MFVVEKKNFNMHDLEIIAKRITQDYINKHKGALFDDLIDVEKEPYIVKTFESSALIKWLMKIDLYPGETYFEITFDGKKKEWNLMVYENTENITIPMIEVKK